jgi:ribosomal protein S18 acetylase RimI-like enzyme
MITNCDERDFTMILQLYAAARDLQRERGRVVWPDFDDDLMKTEIAEGRQWKMLIDGRIACNWAVTFRDKQIWEDKDQDDAIYIHRLCTHPDFRGQRLVDAVIEWARPYAANKGRKYIRLDTLGNNAGLIRHYLSAGFDYLGIVRLADTSGLPKHYQDYADCCLFEMRVV